MKFGSFFSLALGLSSSVLASPTRTAGEATVVERDLATMTSIISEVGGAVGDLHKAIKAYNGGPIKPVQQASNELISTIEQGTQDAKASSDLTFSEAISLSKPVQDLIGKVEATIGDLVSKKQMAVEACAGQLVLKSLKEQKAASEALADAITSKVPSGAQELASRLASGIADAIQKGIDAYKNVPGCSSSTGGASTGAPTNTGGSTPTATGGGSTEAPTATETPTTTGGGGGGGPVPTSSTPVIPTSSSAGGASSSATPSGTAPGGGAGGSGSSSAPTPTFTGAAGKTHASYGLGAVAAVAALAL
ncbi:Cell wall [Aspergillus sp. HF37]|nr:Cell wall [Aspergillus sp. HF37]